MLKIAHVTLNNGKVIDGDELLVIWGFLKAHRKSGGFRDETSDIAYILKAADRVMPCFQWELVQMTRKLPTRVRNSILARLVAEGILAQKKPTNGRGRILDWLDKEKAEREYLADM